MSAPLRAQSRSEGLVAWGMLATAAIVWAVRPGTFIADDSYSYLVVARNIVLDGEVTFSGVTPTNGIHPLWQGVVAAWYALLSLGGEERLYEAGWTVVPAAASLVGLLVVGRRLATRLDVSAALFLVPLLAFLLPLSLLGSEAHLLSLALVGCALVAVEPERPAWVVGAASALVVLTRWDAALVLLPGALAWLASRQRWRERIVPVAVGAVVLGPALAWNRALGGWVPISGWIKSSFPTVHIQGWGGEGLSTSLAGLNLVFGWGSLALAVATVVGARAAARTPAWRTLALLTAGAALQTAYVALFTRACTGWFWYSVPAVLAACLGLATWLRRRRVASIVTAAVVATACALALKVADGSALPESLVSLRLASALELRHEAVLVSDYPGYLAFHTDLHVVAADFLTGDRRTLHRLRSSPDGLQLLLELAAARGRPIEAVFDMGNRWMTFGEEPWVAVWNDPKTYPAGDRLGAVALPGPPSAVEGRFRAWKLPLPDSSDAGDDGPARVR